MSFVFQSADLSNDQATAIWAGLQKGLREIQNGNASHLRFEELYRNAYTLVLHKFGDMLYEGASETIREKLEVSYNTITTTPQVGYLEVVKLCWEEHKFIMTMIRDVLMYLDKTYCLRAKKAPIYDRGFELFRDTIVLRDNVINRLRSCLLEKISEERNGMAIDRLLMRACISMLVECNVVSKQLYLDEFETPFLLQTSQFYEREAQSLLSRNSVPEYLLQAETRLKEEETRAQTYLDQESRAKLMNVYDDQIISRFSSELLANPGSGLRQMLLHDEFDDLARLYRLFSRTELTLTTLQESIHVYVKELGVSIVQCDENKKNPQVFVGEVLKLRSKYFGIIKKSFADDRAFLRTIKDAFEYFINLDTRAAQYLSLYLDELIKRGLRDMSEDAIESALDEVVIIFRFLTDKDVFEDFYKHHLSNRLLQYQGLSDDKEKLMLSKLKAECGHQFTSKLEGMIKNIELSKGINDTFHSRISNNVEQNNQSPDLHVSVLTNGFWPFPFVEPCRLPESVNKVVDSFTEFYKDVHSGHRLSWHTALGNAEVLCNFKSGTKEFHVHTYQMCILMLFNTSDSLSFSAIQVRTQIPEKELPRHLLSLAHPKVRMLSLLSDV